MEIMQRTICIDYSYLGRIVTIFLIMMCAHKINSAYGYFDTIYFDKQILESISDSEHPITDQNSSEETDDDTSKSPDSIPINETNYSLEELEDIATCGAIGAMGGTVSCPPYDSFEKSEEPISEHPVTDQNPSEETDDATYKLPDSIPTNETTYSLEELEDIATCGAIGAMGETVSCPPYDSFPKCESSVLYYPKQHLREEPHRSYNALCGNLFITPNITKNYYGRLKPGFREIAQLKDPIDILARAVRGHFYNRIDFIDVPLENIYAISDLAVTGRISYEKLLALNYNEIELHDSIRKNVLKLILNPIEGRCVYGPSCGSDSYSKSFVIISEQGIFLKQEYENRLENSISFVIDRALKTARALRGTVKVRKKERKHLGWIAVSGDDDRPHRPVNVLSAPHPQRDIQLIVNSFDTQGNSVSQLVSTRVVFIGAKDPKGDLLKPVHTIGGQTIRKSGALRPSRDRGGAKKAESSHHSGRSYEHDHPKLKLQKDSKIFVSSGLTKALPQEYPIPNLDANILLFFHGHGSRAEEALELGSKLIKESEKINYPLMIIAMDLPGYAYSETLDPDSLGNLPMSVKPRRFSGLEFLENYIFSFVEHLESLQPGIKERIIGVMGGSLGGNLALRMAYQDQQIHTWLKRIVAWSPASVWDSFGDHCEYSDSAGYSGCDFDIIAGFDKAIGAKKETAVWGTRKNFQDKETPELRSEFFFSCEMMPSAHFTYADKWYSNNFDCKNQGIQDSRWTVGEFYSNAYRKWHWRTAHEQLIYSHQDNIAKFNDNIPVLLLVGEDDNEAPEYLASNAKNHIARHLGHSQSQFVWLDNTGHSIHYEKPAVLADYILKFIEEDLNPTSRPN